MRFTLEPTARQLALSVPFLLITLATAMSADEGKPGPALPPPSLYDVIPPDRLASPAPPVSTSSASTPSTSTPSVSTPSISTPSASTAAAPVPPPTAASKAADPVKPAPPSVAAKPVRAGGLVNETGGRGQYAFNVPRCTVRTGIQANCVKMGLWSPGVATSNRDPSEVALKPIPPKSAATVAATQPSKSPGLSSNPAPTPVRETRAEPVEVVLVTPPPPAARAERRPEPEMKEETLTALAETRFMREPDFDQLTLSAGAMFPLSSSNIKPSGHEKLDEFVEHLKGMQFETVRIVGHTDPTGPKAMNERLSKRRAEVVKNYLVSKGIDPIRIKTAGKGGSEPLPKAKDCDALPRTEKIICYAPDRRVEIDVVGGKPKG